MNDDEWTRYCALPEEFLDARLSKQDDGWWYGERCLGIWLADSFGPAEAIAGYAMMVALVDRAENNGVVIHDGGAGIAPRFMVTGDSLDACGNGDRPFSALLSACEHVAKEDSNAQ